MLVEPPGIEPVRSDTVRHDNARFVGYRGVPKVPDRASTCPTVRRRDDSRDDSDTPRVRLVAALTEAIRVAIAAGDLHVARVAHEALGRLLGSEGVADSVVDLETERTKRRKE
jgi:hypothetical protein